MLHQLFLQLPGSAQEYVAWVGPCICAAHYEVGEDVWGQFVCDYPEQLRAHSDPQKRFLDLRGIAAAQLNQIGVSTIHHGNWCTYRDRRLYSHRAYGHGVQAAGPGRLASLIYIKPD